MISVLTKRLRHPPGRSRSSLLAALLLAAGTGHFDEVNAQGRYLQDGLPCVKEMCVGDDTRSLRSINWTPAINPSTKTPLAASEASEAVLTRLKKVIKVEPAVLRVLAPYWYLRLVDGRSLPLLEEIDAVCESMGVSQRLKAEYFDDQGLRTVVAFEPRANSRRTSPTFIVASITQFIPILGPSHANAIGRQMMARYRSLSAYASETHAAAAWIPESPIGPHLRLFAPTGAYESSAINLQGHGRCVGDHSESESRDSLP